MERRCRRSTPFPTLLNTPPHHEISSWLYISQRYGNFLILNVEDWDTENPKDFRETSWRAKSNFLWHSLLGCEFTIWKTRRSDIHRREVIGKVWRNPRFKIFERENSSHSKCRLFNNCFSVSNNFEWKSRTEVNELIHANFCFELKIGIFRLFIYSRTWN